jgi:hypothetical protein
MEALPSSGLDHLQKKRKWLFATSARMVFALFYPEEEISRGRGRYHGRKSSQGRQKQNHTKNIVVFWQKKKQEHEEAGTAKQGIEQSS